MHLLVGQVAVGLRDRRLRDDARAFLVFLAQPELVAALDRAQASGAPDLGPPLFS